MSILYEAAVDTLLVPTPDPHERLVLHNSNSYSRLGLASRQVVVQKDGNYQAGEGVSEFLTSITDAVASPLQYYPCSLIKSWKT